MTGRRYFLKLSLLVAAAMATGMAITHGGRMAHADNGKPAAQKTLPTVTVTSPVARDLPIRLTAQGHLVALEQVDVRPQVAGVIRSVGFHEGDTVKRGQLLFTLDATEAEAQ